MWMATGPICTAEPDGLRKNTYDPDLNFSATALCLNFHGAGSAELALRTRFVLSWSGEFRDFQGL